MESPLAKLSSVLTPKRTWFQFRLRTLFVLVVIAAVPCGRLKWKMICKDRERAAVAEIKRLGGKVHYDWQLAAKKEPPGDAWLRNLMGDNYSSSVIQVYFKSTVSSGEYTAADDWLVHLRPLGDLETVSLGGKQITDAGMVHLTGLSRLRHLNLDHTGVTDAGMVHVTPLTRLESLSLQGTAVTDASLIHFKRLPRLRHLSLNITRVTDAGAAELQKALPNCRISR